MISPQGGYVTGSIWHRRLSANTRAIEVAERLCEADGLDCNKECRRASRKHGTGSILLRIYMGWPGVRPLAACGITSLPPQQTSGPIPYWTRFHLLLVAFRESLSGNSTSSDRHSRQPRPQ